MEKKQKQKNVGGWLSSAVYERGREFRIDRFNFGRNEKANHEMKVFVPAGVNCVFLLPPQQEFLFRGIAPKTVKRV